MYDLKEDQFGYGRQVTTPDENPSTWYLDLDLHIYPAELTEDIDWP